MNKKMVFIFVVLALAVLVSLSCTTKRNTAAALNEGTIEKFQWGFDVSENADGRTNDANISSAIMLKFANDDLLSSSRINVDTTNGSVTLSGKVKTQLKVDRAMELGRSVEGVRRVRSNLIVQEQ
ncbi:MAG TPA: BON domain-containing protein [Acidobacteriota bacterium]|jgi:osmotically-inducible protein OsmY|nr:BON domain-containing protein [Acidobacteriota bacterium]